MRAWLAIAAFATACTTKAPQVGVDAAGVHVTFAGGLSTVPADPGEAVPDQYPESNMFGDLPAWAYFVRHVAGLSFTNCAQTVAVPDARQDMVLRDVQ